MDRCLDIIRYLDDTLDMQYPISRNLNRLYDYFSFELNRVKAGRNRSELDRVKTMVSELRDTFREANKNAVRELANAIAQEEQRYYPETMQVLDLGVAEPEWELRTADDLWRRIRGGTRVCGRSIAKNEYENNKRTVTGSRCAQ